MLCWGRHPSAGWQPAPIGSIVCCNRPPPNRRRPLLRHKPTDVILRARNGDVIAFDETGLILRLSDQVIGDIAGRIGAEIPVDADVLGGLDAWNVRRRGEWYIFDAKVPEFDHTRAFRRRVSGGDVIAEAPGPVQAVLMLGGPRVSQGYDVPVAYPGHVVAPADDLGGAGGMGTVDTRPPPGFQRMYEATQASALGDAIIARRRAAGRSLPLILARAESDVSAGIDTFSGGAALGALVGTVASLVETAETMGKTAQVAAVVLDYGEEDVTSPPEQVIAGLRRIIAELRDVCHRFGMTEPAIILRADGAERLAEQWALAAFPPDRRVCVPGPCYALETDRFGRLTHHGVRQQAALDALAVETIAMGKRWTCPVPVLAEFGSHPGTINVVFEASEPLVIDPTDPFSAGPGAGFDVMSDTGPQEIKTVSIAGDDPKTVKLTLADPKPVGPLYLSYAHHRPGSVRDSWEGAFAPDGDPLHRWALPARLAVH